MPFEHEYGDSVANVKTTPEAWQSLGDLARKLAEKHGGGK